jgi:NADP-dependent 3-hydroxy acid dehydrogenase YdfG
MNTLLGRVAVVTGASRGIGAATARALAAEGLKLGLGSRSGHDLGLNGVVARSCDVRKSEEIERLVLDTVEQFGKVDCLIVNAGVGAYGPVSEVAPRHIDEMIDVNVKGMVHSVRAALPHLLKNGASDIITIASDAARHGAPLEAVYAASKHAQIGFMRSLDQELRPQGVRCATICPGGVATDFAMGEGRGRTPGMPELAGMMAAEEVAEIVLFILTRPWTHRILEVVVLPGDEGSCL